MNNRTKKILVLAPLMDEEGQEVGPTKPKACQMLLEDQRCTGSVNIGKTTKINLKQKQIRMKLRDKRKFHEF